MTDDRKKELTVEYLKMRAWVSDSDASPQEQVVAADRFWDSLENEEEERFVASLATKLMHRHDAQDIEDVQSFDIRDASGSTDPLARVGAALVTHGVALLSISKQGFTQETWVETREAVEAIQGDVLRCLDKLGDVQEMFDRYQNIH